MGAVVSKLGDGVKPATIKEAADADIVVLALPWWEVNTLTNVRDWTGKIVIDITNELLKQIPLPPIRYKDRFFYDGLVVNILIFKFLSNKSAIHIKKYIK